MDAAQRFKVWRHKSDNRFYVKNFLLLLWTTFLVIFISATIKIFDNFEPIGRNKKSAFEGISGGLILLLGLSVFVGEPILAALRCAEPIFRMHSSLWVERHQTSYWPIRATQMRNS